MGINHYAGLILLALYACLLLGMAFSGKRETAAFYVNSRSSGVAAVALSIVVSCVGASATLGMIGMAFAVGTPAFWWLGMGAAGLALQALLLAEKVRESGAYTMPKLVETFLGKQARPLISVVIVIAWMAILAAQFTAAARVLGPMTGMPENVCRVIGFLLIVAHCLGGQAAIIRADRFQAAILVAALVLLMAWLSSVNPGWLEHVDLRVVNDTFPPEQFFYFMIVVGANYLVCPMLFGRLLSARDEKTARRGALWGAVGIAVCAALIVGVGLACKGLIAAGTAQDAVLTTALYSRLPQWMALLVSFALISAIVSSADSCLVTAATVLSYDILKKEDAATGRAAVLGLGFIGMGVSLWGKTILGFLLMAYDVYACGVVVPVFVGLLVSRTRIIDTRFACAAVVAGGMLGIIAALSGMSVFSYVGMAVAGCITLAGARTASVSKCALQEERMEIVVKRVYEEAGKDDGFRVLVDRLWPRGLSREKAALDAWDKELAPSAALREWFNHEPEKWSEFQKRYAKELADNPQPLDDLKEQVKCKKKVTLLYAAKDTEHNNAVALKKIIETTKG